MVREYTNLTIVGRKNDFPDLRVSKYLSRSHYTKVRFHAFYRKNQLWNANLWDRTIFVSSQVKYLFKYPNCSLMVTIPRCGCVDLGSNPRQYTTFESIFEMYSLKLFAWHFIKHIKFENRFNGQCNLWP